MAYFKLCVALSILSISAANPAPKSFWKDSPFGTTVEEMRSMCNNNDALACLKYKTMSFLDNLFRKDSYKLSDYIEINKNSYRSNEITSRSDNHLEDKIEEYVKSHDVTVKLPIFGSTLTLDAKNLDSDELNIKIKSDSTDVQARKSKLKKIFIPILIFILLKAMTLIPLALGVLGLKAWNSLQLSFFSFVISVGLAIFQLCKKLAVDNAGPQIAAHAAWEPGYPGRSFDDVAPVVQSGDAQDIAYSAYREE